MRPSQSYRAERRNEARRQKVIRHWRKFGQIKTKEGAVFIAAPQAKS